MTVDKIAGYNELNNAQKGVIGNLHTNFYSQGKVPTDKDYRGIDLDGLLVAQTSYGSQMIKFSRKVDIEQVKHQQDILLENIVATGGIPYKGGAIPSVVA